MLTLAGLVFALSACGGGDSGDDPLSGTWDLQDLSSYPGTWEFADGRVTISEDEGGSSCSGTYEVDGEEVTIDVECTAGGLGNSDGYNDTITGTIINEDRIEVEVSNGKLSGVLIRAGTDGGADESDEGAAPADTAASAPTSTTTTTSPTTTTAPATTTTASGGASRASNGFPLDPELWCQDAKALAARIDPQTKVAIWGDGGPAVVFVKLGFSPAYRGAPSSSDARPDQFEFALFTDTDDMYTGAIWNEGEGFTMISEYYDPLPSEFLASASLSSGEVQLDCDRPMPG